MNSLMFLCFGAGIFMVMAVKYNSQVQRVVKTHGTKTKMLSKVVGALFLSAQVSELAKVVEHVSMVNLVAAFFLLAIMLAAKSGTESELL
jgi:uncharacterized membrane protein YdcZ (DUF606 family)